MLGSAILVSVLVCYFAARGGVHAIDAGESTVILDYGTFIGAVDASTGIISYRGVRFADPPIGELRWRAPVSPPTSNQGIVHATEYAPMCISTQSSTIPTTMSEDCLFGNIYVPIGANITSNLPVLVYWHGGGYQGGSARSAPPEWLMASTKEPFIFVTFQYRLGQFGFLAGNAVFNDGAGNAGLLDQRASLRWVQKYIPYFGGDPGRVTIWGQSAGAGLIMFQLIGNGGNNEGLFSQAMGDSPPLSAMPAYDAPEVNDLFNRFATLAGCDVLSPYLDVMPCLRAASSSALASAGSLSLQGYHARLYPYTPIADGIFIKEPPIEAFRHGHFALVPTFFGSNTNEGAHWSSRLPDPIANTARTNATEYSVYSFLAGQYSGLSTDTFKGAMKLYPLQTYNSSTDRQGQQMYGEMRYICTAGLITGASETAGLDAYHYHYDNPHLGAFHHYELQAMFSVEPTDFPPDTNDLALFEVMRQYWTSFVTGGEPRADGAPLWTMSEKSKTGSPRMLLSPAGVRMEDVDDGLRTRCSFWHEHSRELKT